MCIPVEWNPLQWYGRCGCWVIYGRNSFKEELLPSVRCFCFTGCRCAWRVHVQHIPTYIQFDRTVVDVREVVVHIVPLSSQIITVCLLGDTPFLPPMPFRRSISSALCHHTVLLQKISKDELRHHLKFRTKIALMQVGEGISASNTLVHLLDTRNVSVTTCTKEWWLGKNKPDGDALIFLCTSQC